MKDLCAVCDEAFQGDEPETPSEMDLRLRRDVPLWWCRIEVVRLQDLLKQHVHLAIDTGTEPERVLAFLDRVRELILNPNKRPTQPEHQEQHS